MITLGHVLSIQIGQIQAYVGAGDLADLWASVIRKKNVSRVVHVGNIGIAGDEHADFVKHGGPDKAVLAYAWKHYQA